MVGGCCGTTPDHIEAFYGAVKNSLPRRSPEIEHFTRLRVSNRLLYDLTVILLILVNDQCYRFCKVPEINCR
ncbi:MAG: hypothetical protein Ct9H300mP9_4830 [Candidatus Neomarinimicrobiota bacterium]|nr:MAG: hypothetical protein Ct9H300mP9_4830 [Candidatus Neomarinimicrobiota bacterium]